MCLREHWWASHQCHPAAVHGVDFLLTWNCTHIANAAFRGRIMAACTASGHRPPEIATPEQLLTEESDVG